MISGGKQAQIINFPKNPMSQIPTLPNQNEPPEKTVATKAREYLITGLLAAVPLVVTWFILDVLFRLLSTVGRPFALILSTPLSLVIPGISSQWVVDIMGAILVVALLFGLGWAARDVFASRFLNAAEAAIGRIPVVQVIYGGVKKFMDVMSRKPGSSVQRVVLIDFPSRQMKAIGLVTRTMKDEKTGEELVAVYVPTTPNPTSGYLEIVPVSRVISTDWTVDEATAFVVSGGAVGRETIAYSQSNTAAPPSVIPMPGPQTDH